MRPAHTLGDRACPRTAESLSVLSADVSEEFPIWHRLQGKRKSAATIPPAVTHLSTVTDRMHALLVRRADELMLVLKFVLRRNGLNGIWARV